MPATSSIREALGAGAFGPGDAGRRIRCDSAHHLAVILCGLEGVLAHRPPRAPEPAALIRKLAGANRLWGAERIRGELLKRGIRVDPVLPARGPPAAPCWAAVVDICP